MQPKTYVKCSKCGATEEIWGAKRQGWLIAPRKGRREMVIRCPKHVTKSAFRQAGEQWIEVKNFEAYFVPVHRWMGIRPHNERLYINDKLACPSRDQVEYPKGGDKFRLEIPNGTLTGIIYTISKNDNDEEIWRIVQATWTGELIGLIDGQCEIGWFKAWTQWAEVRSPVIDEELSYNDYVAMLRFVDAACGIGNSDSVIWLGPRVEELLPNAWRYLQALRKEAQRIAEEIEQQI